MEFYGRYAVEGACGDAFQLVEKKILHSLTNTSRNIENSRYRTGYFREAQVSIKISENGGNLVFIEMWGDESRRNKANSILEERFEIKLKPYN